MNRELQRFAADLEAVSSYQDYLPALSFYIAGRCHQSTHSDIGDILSLISAIEEMSVAGTLSIDRRLEALHAVANGRVEEAERIIKAMPRPDIREQNKPRKSDFTQVIETEGKVFLMNPSTGEILSLEEVDALEDDGPIIDAHEELKKSAESEQLAWELQRLDDLHPVEKPKCEICLSPIEDSELLPLETCGHLFHPSCINTYLEMCVNESRFPMVCPIGSCRAEVHPLDIKERLCASMLAKFEEFSFKSYLAHQKDALVSCPTPDCPFVFERGTESEFSCPVCSKRYCLRCEVPYHVGMTCDRFQLTHKTSSKQFLQYVRRSGYKKCPGCRFWVSKIDGCNSMRCRCGMRFCYGCGSYATCTCKSMRIARPLVSMMRGRGLISRNLSHFRAK